MPDLSLMKAGRIQTDAYCFYCYFFLSWVVGRSRFRKHFSVGGKLSDIVTPSDQAFGLVYLESSWKNWAYKCDNDPNKVVKDEIPATLYTIGSGKFARKLGGWNKEGLSALAALQRFFKEERNNKVLVASFDQEFGAYLFKVTSGMQGWKPPSSEETENDKEQDFDDPEMDFPSSGTREQESVGSDEEDQEEYQDAQGEESVSQENDETGCGDDVVNSGIDEDDKERTSDDNSGQDNEDGTVDGDCEDHGNDDDDEHGNDDDEQSENDQQDEDGSENGEEDEINGIPIGDRASI